MAKEKVFIVLSHKHSLKPGTKDDWEVTETVEFVNQLRNKHTTMSSAVGDYLEKKMLVGTKVGMTDYDQFESYVRKKYAGQMAELDSAYRPLRKKEPEQAVFVDQFGNLRAKTVFDL